MHSALDQVPLSSVVWMPAHTKESDVGAKTLSDGSLLTERDRRGNDRADTLAKMAVGEHRLPDILRLQIAMLNKHAEQVAVSVARISAAVLDRTAAGGGHDSVASRRAACTAANRLLVRSRKPHLGRPHDRAGRSRITAGRHRVEVCAVLALELL